MEAVLSRHHMLTVPEGLQDSTQTRASSIPFQYDEMVVPVNGVIGLPEVPEYQEEGWWSMLTSSWASFKSIIAVPIPLLSLNPWSISFICRLPRLQVSISTSTTFHMVSNRPMTHVSVVPFGIRTRTNHPRSWGISPVHHICCTRSTRHIQHSLRGGGVD